MALTFRLIVHFCKVYTVSHMKTVCLSIWQWTVLNLFGVFPEKLYLYVQKIIINIKVDIFKGDPLFLSIHQHGRRFFNIRAACKVFRQVKGGVCFKRGAQHQNFCICVI